MVEVKPKPEEKLDLPFQKVEQEGIDEDDLEESDPDSKPTIKQNPNHTEDNNNDGIEVLETLHFDEVLENDLVANSGQTLSDDHDEVVSQVLRDEDVQVQKINNPFEGLMAPITLFK